MATTESAGFVRVTSRPTASVMVMGSVVSAGACAVVAQAVRTMLMRMKRGMSFLNDCFIFFSFNLEIIISVDLLD